MPPVKMAKASMAVSASSVAVSASGDALDVARGRGCVPGVTTSAEEIVRSSPSAPSTAVSLSSCTPEFCPSSSDRRQRLEMPAASASCASVRPSPALQLKNANTVSI